LALRGLDILRSHRLLREADSEARRSHLSSIRLAAASFRGQVKARKRAKAPLREAGSGSVADPPIAVAAARPTRSAAVVSRALTRDIVQAALPLAVPSATASAASPPVSRGSSGMFVSSPPPLVCSPVALYEGDITMLGAVASSVLLGPRSPSPSVIPAGPSSSPPSLRSPPAAPFAPVAPSAPASPAAPASPVAVAATTRIIALLERVVAQGDEQLLVLRRVEAVAAELLTRLRGSVSFSIVLLLLEYD
jgi:hypothetical protein